ncbi:MAG: sugar phosphate isomerase/epimerase [Lachnospiraceae bacterium]|nr:sugar phosphate isomerase/epimerase [Lachnospiraceae bacterium]
MEKWKIFAFADEASPWLDGQIAALKRNGLSGLELRNVDHQNVSELTKEKAREIRRRLDDEGLAVWTAASLTGKTEITGGGFGDELEKFRHTLEIARLLGAKNVRVFSFYLPPGRPSEEYQSEVLNRLGALCELAGEQGLCLCHENEKGIYGDTPEHCRELLAGLPGLRAIFDPANFVQCGQNAWQAWQLLRPFVKYLHIKDARADGRIVPAGEGAGQIGAILADYGRMGGRQVTLEPHLALFDGLAALERDGETSCIEEAYADNDTAFDAAAKALAGLMEGV